MKKEDLMLAKMRADQQRRRYNVPCFNLPTLCALTFVGIMLILFGLSY